MFILPKNTNYDSKLILNSQIKGKSSIIIEKGFF